MERERKEIKDCPDGRWCVYSGWMEKKNQIKNQTKQNNKTLNQKKKSVFGNKKIKMSLFYNFLLVENNNDLGCWWWWWNTGSENFIPLGN